MRTQTYKHAHVSYTHLRIPEDPTAWGYHPLVESHRAFEPNHDSLVPPFQLLLVGSQYIGIPEELEHVVVVHRDLLYKDFYNLIANADIVLPAFADNSCESPPFPAVHRPRA